MIIWLQETKLWVENLNAFLFIFGLRNMYCVWRAYLEGTVQVTQSRISACDNYKVQVADPAKTGRLQKEQQLRKVIQVHFTTLLQTWSLSSSQCHFRMISSGNFMQTTSVKLINSAINNLPNEGRSHISSLMTAISRVCVPHWCGALFVWRLSLFLDHQV